MRTYRKFKDDLIEELRADPEYAQAYLQVAFEEYEQDGDMEMLLLSLRRVAEAQGGVPELARKLNMPKTSLYHALSEKGNPHLSTISAILHGLGYKLALVPMNPETV